MVPMVSAVVWSLVSNVFTLDTPTGVVVVVVVVVDNDDDDDDRFCIALFFALEQTHCALVGYVIVNELH